MMRAQSVTRGGVRRRGLVVGSVSILTLLGVPIGCSSDAFRLDRDNDAGEGGEGDDSGNGGTRAGSAGQAASGASTSGGSTAAAGKGSSGASGSATAGPLGGGGGALAGSGGAAGSETAGSNQGGASAAGTGAGGVSTAGVGAGGVPTAGAGTGGIATAGSGQGGMSGGPSAGSSNGGAGQAGSSAGSGGSAGLGGSAGTGGTPASTLPFKEDFEDGNLSDWTAVLSVYATSFSAGTGANNTSRSLRLTKTEDTGFCCDGFQRTFSAGITPTRLSFWIRSDATGTDAGYLRISGSTDANQWLAYVSFYESGIYLISGQSFTVTYTPGRFYQIEFRNIDWTAHNFDYWVDGAQVALDVPMREAVASMKRLDLYGRTANESAYIDEIEMTQELAQ